MFIINIILFPIKVFGYIVYIIVGGNVTAYPCAVNKETRSDGETGKHTGFKLLRAEMLLRVRFPLGLQIE